MSAAPKIDIAAHFVKITKTGDLVGIVAKDAMDGTHGYPYIFNVAKEINDEASEVYGKILIGDLVISVNGISCKGKKHELVHDIVNRTPKGKEIRWELVTPPKKKAPPAKK